MFNFHSTYKELPAQFFSNAKPEPVASPTIVIFNEDLAQAIGVDIASFNDRQKADLFSGNKVVDGSEPFSQAYAGHQFGHFTMLGDGRAHILGEHVTQSGEKFDIQLKGSGRTPYSRRGDGRAVLGPMLREYIIAEAMHSLGIPTTRSLAVVSTGESVMREQALPGAILTRLSSSHIRVGTFEFAANYENGSSVSSLLDYTLERHYPSLIGKENKAVSLIEAVMEKQAELIVHWMRVGFVHGVMNTDNMALSGEGIDYGPCAFMDSYDPEVVFSSIDRMGRYSYTNQPNIAQWNLARLIETMLPLIDNDPNKAIEIAKETIGQFSRLYKDKGLAMMRSKLGLVSEQDEDEKLIWELLSWMKSNNADHTNTFHDLINSKLPKNELYQQKQFQDWHTKWQSRLEQNNQPLEESLSVMRSTNPAVIPRNHKVEEALEAAHNSDFNPLHKLLAALKDPYKDRKDREEYQKAPEPTEKVYQTYCGT